MKPEADPRPRRRWLRRALVVVVVCAVLVVALGSALPAWFSSDSGRAWLLERVSASIPGRLSAVGIDLNWSDGQRFESLRLEDAAGGTIATVRLVAADITLAQILRGEYGTGRIVIEGLELDLVLDEQGRLNLVGAITAPDAQKSAPIDLPALLREFVIELPSSIKADIELRDARVSLTGPTMSTPLQLTEVAGTLRLEGVGAPIEFDLAGMLGPGSRARLTARLEGFDAKGRLRASDATLALSLDAEMADGAEASVGMLRRLLGPTAHLDVTVRTSRSGAEFEVDVRSPRLVVKAPGGVEVTAGQAPRLRVTEGARARYVVTPAFLRAVAAEDSEIALADDVDISLAVASLDLPLDGSDFALDARLTVADGRVDVTVADVAESLAWRGWAASIRKQASDDAAEVELRGRIEEGEIEIEGTLRWPADGNLRVSVRSFPLARIDRVAESFTGRRRLLVDALGPTLDLEGKIEKDGPQTARVELRVDSQRLKLTAPLAVDFERDIVHAENVKLEYTLAPALVPGLGIEKSLPIRLDVSLFTGRLSGFDPHATALQGKLSVGATRLGGAVPVDIRGATVEIDSESFAEGLRLHAECRVDEGRIGAEGDLAGLWDEAGRLQPAKARGRLQVDIERLPVARIESALGDVLNGRVTLDGDGKDAKLDVRLRSERLDVTLPMLVSQGRVRLREAAHLRYTLTPETAWRFLPARQADATIDQWSVARLAEPVDVVLQLHSVDVPADGSLPLEDVRARGTLSLGPVRLDRASRAGTVSLTDWSVEFDGESLAAPRFVFKGAVESSRLSLGGPVHIDAKGDADSAEIRLVASDRLALDIAVVREADSFRLREPARLDAEVRRDLLRQLELSDDWLRGPLKVGVVVETMRMPRDGDWRSGEASFRLNVPEARLRIDGRDVALRELSMHGAVAQQIEAELKGKLGEGDVSVRVNLADRSRDAAFALTARMRKFPTGLLGETVSRYAGATADLTLDAELPGGWRAGGDVSLTANTPQLELDVKLKGQDQWRLARPAKLTWTMTPATFRALLPDTEMRLAAPAVLRIDVAEFAFAAGSASLADASLTARAQIPEVRVRGRKGDELSVRALVLDVKAANLREPVQVDLDGRLEGGAKPGRVRGELVVEFLGDEHAPIVFAEDHVAVRADLEFEGLAVQPLDALLAMDGYLPAVLGESAGGKFVARITRGEGPIDVVLSSGNLQASVAARLTRRSLLLRRPVQAKLTHSKALADKVLPKLGPLFQGIVATEAPMRVVIADRGFSVPRAFNLADVVVPHVVLDIGKVTMENQTLVRVVQQLSGSAVPDRTDAWFTPVEVSLRGGILRYTRRLDLLLERRYHFSTWGKADLVRERLDMVLGVMPETLKEILRIKGVGRADTLRIKVSGPLAKPRIDTGRAVADLALIRGKDDALRNLPRLARPLAEAALRKLLKKTFQGPPPLGPSVDPLPWKKRER